MPALDRAAELGGHRLLAFRSWKLCRRWSGRSRIVLVEAIQQTWRQHLVSQVVLKEFVMRGRGSNGWRLLQFDLQYPERHYRLRPASRCGWAKDFVAFESGSAEQLWGRIEARDPAALEQADEVNTGGHEPLFSWLAIVLGVLLVHFLVHDRMNEGAQST